MSVTRSSGYSTSNTGSSVTTYDMDTAGIAVGDWAIISILGSLTAGTWTSSLSGWTTLVTPTTLGTRRGTILARKRLVGDTSTFTFTANSNNSQRGVLVGVSGAVDVASWVLGAFTTRATMGSDGYHNIIPGVTTTTNDNLIVTVSFEATTVDEAGAKPTVANATEWVFVGQAGAGTTIETVGYYYSDQATAGATPTVTTTYSNIQASNGAGIQIGIPAASTPATGAGTVTITGAGTGSATGVNSGAGTMTVTGTGNATGRTTGAGTLSINGIALGATGYVARWLNLPNPMTAHRGGWASTLGEETLAAYTASAAWNTDLALEMSVYRCSTGEWVLSHDPTTGRVFGTDLTIQTSTWSALSGLRSTAGNNPIAKLDDLLPVFATGTRVIFLDNKAQNNSTALLDLLDTYGGKDRFIAKNNGPGTAWASAARARGYKGWGYYYPADIPTMGSTQASWDLLGMSYGATAAEWAATRAYGKPVLAHILDTAASYPASKALGAFGYMVSNIPAVVPASAGGSGTLVVSGAGSASGRASGAGNLGLSGSGAARANGSGNGALGVGGTGTGAATATTGGGSGDGLVQITGSGQPTVESQETGYREIDRLDPGISAMFGRWSGYHWSDLVDSD